MHLEAASTSNMLTQLREQEGKERRMDKGELSEDAGGEKYGRTEK